MRAVGHGLRIFVIFFMKGNYPYGERDVLSKLPNVEVSSYGQTEFVDPKNIKPDQIAQAGHALSVAREAMLSGNYDMIVLDEVNIAAAAIIAAGLLIGAFLGARFSLSLLMASAFSSSVNKQPHSGSRTSDSMFISDDGSLAGYWRGWPGESGWCRAAATFPRSLNKARRRAARAAPRVRARSHKVVIDSSDLRLLGPTQLP